MKLTTKPAILALLALAACGGGGDSVAPPPPPVPTSIQLTAQGSTAIAAGGTVQFAAVVLDQRSAPMAGRPVTFASSAGIGSIGSSGLFTSAGPVGSTNITATSGNISSQAVAITINPSAPTALAKVAGDNQSAVVGTPLPIPLSVRASDAYGNSVPGATIAWSAAAGQATPGAPTSVTGSDGTATATITLGTTASPIAVTATLNTAVSATFAGVATNGPASVITKVDGDQQTAFIEAVLPTSPRVVVRDQYGNPVPAAVVSFAIVTGNGTVATASTGTDASGIAATGWTLGSRVANNTLRASTPGTTPVLFAATAESPYSIDIRYLSSFSVAHQSAIAASVAKWRRAVLSNLGSFQLAFPADDCFIGQPALNEVHRNLLIYVRILPIDGPGGVLANAGICYVEQTNSLPVVSIMTVDQADLSYLDVNGLFGVIFTHELGHAVGISGSLFQFKGLNGGTIADPYFMGAIARGEFARRVPGYGGTPVPLEDTGGAGTAGSHWRASIFGDELMIGFFGPGSSGPLSSVTIGALQDLGYRVDLLSADLFGAAAQSTMSRGRKIDLGADVVHYPRRSVRPIRP